MRRGLLLAVLLLAVSVSAVNFDVSISPHERSIKFNESAIFEIVLEHDSPVEEVYEVYSNDVTWDVRLSENLKVPANGMLKTSLFIRPLNVNPGAYNIPINFKRAGGSDQERRVLYIELQSPFPEDATYLPAVRGVVEVSPLIDPREGMTIMLSLENQNRLILEEVDVKVRSNVINKDYTTSLGPLEKKKLTFIADLDPLTPPSEDMLHVTIIVPQDDKAYQFDLFPVKYEVISYGVIDSAVESSESFLKRAETVILTNNANKLLSHVYRVTAWFGKRLFISSTPEAMKVADGLSWEVSLQPGQSTQIFILYNYRPLFWLFLIIVVIILAYFFFRSPLVLEKRASVVGSHEEGISEIKVVIEIVNRSNKAVTHVNVMDLAPSLVTVLKEFKETMLAPTKIVPHEARGTLVKWEIDAMEPKEHRILTYKAKTKLSVVGGLTLPVTAVRFRVDGSEREIVSNKAEIRL